MKKVVVVVLFLVFFMPGGVYARSGCCSHHGGVAGCSPSGRQVCVDGSLSPTCTCDGGSSSNRNSREVYTPPTYIYGCTDSNALNYNSSATKDDGSCIAKKFGCMDQSAINYDSSANVENHSCQYKSEKTETKVIKYRVKYKGNDNALKGTREEVSHGKNGKKEIVYEVIVDKDGKELSKKKISEKVILEPKDKIIEEGTKKEVNENSIFGVLIWIFSIIFSFRYFHAHRDDNLILTRISKKPEWLQFILYLLYVLSIFLPLVDSVIIFMNLLRARKV